MRLETRQEVWTPVDLGVNGVTFAVAFNSTAFGSRGFNQLSIHYEITRVAATDLSFYLSTRPKDASSYGRLRIGDLDPATGIETLRLRQFVIPDTATAASQSGTINVPINEEGNMRLENIVGTAATTDTLKMWVTLGVV